MPQITPSWVQTHPSFTEPEAIMQYNQRSGFADLLATRGPRVKIGPEDKQIFIRRFRMTSNIQGNQAAGNLVPSPMISAEMIQMPTYLNRLRSEYDHHDTAMFSAWGGNAVEAYRLAMRQGHAQALRTLCLYGYQPTNGEGLLHTAGATAVTLPPDSFGDTTVVTYDNGQLALWFLSLMLGIKTRTMNLGEAQRFTICGPQRVLGLMEYNIVQLTSYQRAGAGSNSSAGTVKDVAGWNGDNIDWTYDDTLIGKGAGGTDAIIFTMPEVKKPDTEGMSTNAFAALEPGLDATTLMYVDVAAPIEIPTPLPAGKIDVMTEMRASPGWGVRPEAVTIASLQYQ
jgi:hypothetical protein